MGIADELITRGWHQGFFNGPDGTVCIMGAAFASCGYIWGDWESEPLDFETEQRLWRVVHKAIGLPASAAIGPWNDAPNRTFDEVLRAAKEADEILDGMVTL